jgi:hypothetical protein
MPMMDARHVVVVVVFVAFAVAFVIVEGRGGGWRNGRMMVDADAASRRRAVGMMMILTMTLSMAFHPRSPIRIGIRIRDHFLATDPPPFPSLHLVGDPSRYHAEEVERIPLPSSPLPPHHLLLLLHSIRVNRERFRRRR